MHDQHSSVKLLKSDPFLASLYSFAAARRRAAGATGATSASGQRQRRQRGNPVQQEEDDDEVMNTSYDSSAMRQHITSTKHKRN